MLNTISVKSTTVSDCDCCGQITVVNLPSKFCDWCESHDGDEDSPHAEVDTFTDKKSFNAPKLISELEAISLILALNKA
ncbi:MAG: hypothetical protein ACJAS1_000552 [Oleiphilaceae bacterium]|jgi:hypothetical protein